MKINTDEALTIGVEEEYQIVDTETRQLTGRAKQLMASAQRNSGEISVQAEVYTSMIEIATPVCETLTQVREQLVRARHTIIQAATEDGRAIAAAGTHPFSDWHDQHVTPKKRYEGLVSDYQQIMEDLIIFGCHIHIGIGDREVAVQVLNRTRVWLPLLLALSVNSPFWMAHETGYASYRTELWSRWPFSGAPFTFKDYEEYRWVAQNLTHVEAIRDPTKIYWDIRLSNKLPTLEFRFADVCLTVEEATMLAGLVRALARSCYQEIKAGVPFQSVRPELLQAARWRSARSGLGGNLIDVINCQVMPAADLVHRFLEYLRPVLEELGDWQTIHSLVERTIASGTGAERQRKVYRQTQSFEAVVDFVIDQTHPLIHEATI